MLHLFLVALRVTNEVKSSLPRFGLNTYGFKVNGTFKVSFSDFAPGRYCFALFPVETVDLFICNETEYHTFIGGPDDALEWSGTIATKGIYQPVIAFEPENALRGMLTMKIDQIYRNPDSCQDYRWDGAVTAKVIMIILFVCVFGYWCFNWFTHFSIQIWVHYFLTATFLCAVLLPCFRAAELAILEKNDTSKGMNICRVIFEFFAEEMFFGTLLLLTKGWCIIRDSIPRNEIIKSMVFASLSVVFRLFIDWTDNSAVSFMLIILAMISLVLYMREMITSINDASMHVYAHLLAIRNQGINPRTTPIYQKQALYQRLTWVMMGASIALVLYLIVDIFADIPYMGEELATDLIVFGIMCALCVIFRLKGVGKNSYFKVNEESEQPGEILLTDLEGVSFQEDEGRTWEEGMALPVQPTLIREPRKETQIVLTTPDGTDTLHAELTDPLATA